MIHSFKESLAWGEEASAEPFWEAVYRRAFPDMVSLSRNNAHNTGQRLGIDRWISLSSGKVLAIDEKRRRIERDDILLEYRSNDRTGAPGWINKDLQIDFLAYAFIESRRCYLFPWLLLRRAWLRFGEEWHHKAFGRELGFTLIEAQNPGYVTKSVAVPTSLLLAAVKNASIIDLAASGSTPSPVRPE